MLVSALLTSVGINSGLCVLFFTLYSILRKQPSNYEVYVPRLLAKGSSNRRRRFNLEMLIPSAGWVSRAWKHSEEDLLESSGLDAVVFMRVITFSLKVFLFAGIIGIFVILPVNAGGTEIYEIDFADLPNNSLDVFTISNVNRGSHRLWVHFGAVYLVTIFVCYLLYSEYKYICVKRMDYFYSSKPQPHQFTVLVRSIPVSAGSTVGDTVENFFKEFHPTTYLSHTVIHQTSNLCRLMDYAKKLYGRLIHLQSDSNQEKNQQRKVDLVDHYGKRLENVEENSRLERSEVSMARHELQAAFVSFKSRYGAAIAFHMQQSTNPTDWLLEQAPEPNDVYWPFFSASFMRRWISKIVVVVACILLTILFLIPVLVVQGLTNLNQLEIWFPFLKSILTIKFVSQVVTGYLPNLILLVFLKIVPPVMEFLSSIQGYISHSDIQKSACNKVLWFMIWNIFFATVFSGSVLYQLNIVLDPKNIPSRLGVAVPAQFINVYEPKYETAGKFWPIVHNSMIFSLVLMHAIAVGIFTIKKLSTASTLIFPLPVLTLLFNEYCRKRFLPNFIAYPAEVLIKKDREDQDDATIAEFFDSLAITYRHPAFLAVHHSGTGDSLNRPLLSSPET
ncbi:CSC1-like protein [Citrus sinensis]|uniref:CSC1-like protein n=1 Tax=Citrus sinensis TaxID=2711 RepID=A0ACB8LKT6_CITSI|nr:CSC1-like protein [Citrus sinensis]